MAFFNPKEDVLDIELTQYGKYLLGQGKLKVAFYEFYDDDIIYDMSYAGELGIIEDQNYTNERIQKETPRLKSQHIWTGVQTSFNDSRKLDEAGFDGPLYQNTPDRQFASIFPLGTAEDYSNFVPAWKISYLNGTIFSSSLEYSSSYSHSFPIPQLSSSVDFKSTRIKNYNGEYLDKSVIGQYRGQLEPTEKIDYMINLVGKDGEYIKVEGDYLLVEIGEENCVFDNENFAIEIFEVEDAKDNNDRDIQNLIPLSFKQFEKNKQDPRPHWTDVEYFMKILVDEEISDKILCKHETIENKKNVFSDISVKCDLEDQKTNIKPIPDYTDDEGICS